MVAEQKQTTLRFNGSVWCNLDVAARNAQNLYRRIARPLGLNVVELYILRALYDEDGRHASDLANAVGRAATSFTPNLDRLEEKGWIKRHPDPNDRRAVRIYLTEKGEKNRDTLLQAMERIDRRIADAFTPDDFQAFLKVLAELQNLSFEA